MPNCRLWNAGILAQELDDLLRVGALLQFLKHQHLVLVRLVHRRLARGDALAGHDHGLHALQELVVAIDAGRRRDDDAAGAAVDGDDRPRGGRGRGKNEQRGECEYRPAHQEIIVSVVMTATDHCVQDCACRLIRERCE